MVSAAELARVGEIDPDPDPLTFNGCLGPGAWDLKYKVSSIKYQVSGLRSQVSGLKYQVSNKGSAA